MKRALSFPGSQAAIWHYDGEDIVCEVAEAHNHGSVFAQVVAWIPDGGGWAVFAMSEVTPIGPVARAMMGSR